MKKSVSLFLAVLMVACLCTGCLDSTENPANTDTEGTETNAGAPETAGSSDTDAAAETDSASDNATETDGAAETDAPTETDGATDAGEAPDSNEDASADTEPVLGDDDDTFGEDLTDSDIYDGYFEDAGQDITVECVSGTQNAYTISGNTLTFTGISEDSVYSVSGKLSGNIVIDVSENYKFELEMTGLSLISQTANPIQVQSGKKVTLTAKKGTANYIYDEREAVDESDEALTKGAVHSAVDLQIGGKGTLSVVSDHNNGIHTKDDLEVKNLTLTVVCQDNALKGNDSVTLSGGTVTLIAKAGDGIKTTNSDISTNGNQRGLITVGKTNLTIYAACDGMDAAYNAVIDGEGTVVNIYTDKYSNYSNEVTATSGEVYYIRFTGNAYSYSVKYYNSDSDFEWVNATYHSKVSGGFTNYYYYSFPKKTEYEKMQVFIYSSDMEQGQESEYLVATDYLTPNTTYDTFALTSRNNSLSYSWTNYTTTTSGGGMGGWGGGMGGMNDGNSDKGDHSTKGIKAANEIIITGGTVNVKSYDDALHADNTAALENEEAALGNITISGGNVTLYSNDDGIHAENMVYITGGRVDIENSYEGIEGLRISISGGHVSVFAKDDGMNSTATSGTGVTLSGGYVYIYCTGDGIDSNSRTSYAGICFAGGDAVIISNSSMNSAIDTEQGYSYTAGSIVAIMPSGGMSSEAKHCENFSSVGTSQSMNLSEGSTLTISGDLNKTITMPCAINGLVIILNKNTSVSK